MFTLNLCKVLFILCSLIDDFDDSLFWLDVMIDVKFFFSSSDLRNNSFHGIIPEGFGDLKELEALDLGYNNFSGPVPTDFGINFSLSILYVDGLKHLDFVELF